MKYYDFKKAKEFIDANKDRIARARLGMLEDWFGTAEYVFKDGNYVTNLDACKKLMGIDGSCWATPTMEVVFKDGSKLYTSCHYEEKEGGHDEKRTEPATMGTVQSAEK